MIKILEVVGGGIMEDIAVDYELKTLLMTKS